MMKPAVVILLVAVVAGISAQPTPPKCCVADQFELEADQLVGIEESGKGVAVGQSIKMALDFTNKRFGELVINYVGTQVYKFRVIYDYNKGVEYIIDEKSSTCQKVPYTSANMTQCIPDDAKFLQTYYLGNNQITANSFSYHVTEGPTSGEATISVTKTDCIPLTASFEGVSGGTEMLFGTEFKNFVKGIKDPSTYFTVPSYCPKTFSDEPKAYLNHKHLLFL